MPDVPVQRGESGVCRHGDLLPRATTTADITVRTITVTAAANSKTYDGTTTAAATPTITSGSLGTGDTSGFTESYAAKNAGTGLTLTPSGTVNDGNGGNNYSVTFAASSTGAITPKTLTVTGLTGTNKVYDGTTTATVDVDAATLTGMVSGDTVSLDASTYHADFANKNVGTGKTVSLTNLSLHEADAGNYQLTSTSATTTANITPATLTVTSMVANDKVYDATTTATISGGSLTGVIGSDTVTLGGSGSFVDKNVGTGKTVTATGLTLAGTDSGNYQLTATSVTTTATVTPKTLTEQPTKERTELLGGDVDGSGPK